MASKFDEKIKGSINIEFSDLIRLVNYSAQVQLNLSKNYKAGECFLFLIEQIFVEKLNFSMDEMKEIFSILKNVNEDIAKECNDGRLQKQI